VGEFLGKKKMQPEELKELKKGHPLKIELVAELRKQTTMSMAWITKEIKAGAPNSIWNALRRLQKERAGGKNE
jgi:hypothetical protein